MTRNGRRPYHGVPDRRHADDGAVVGSARRPPPLTFLRAAFTWVIDVAARRRARWGRAGAPPAGDRAQASGDHPRKECAMTNGTSPIPLAGSHLADTRHVCAFFSSDDEEYRVL